MQITWIESVLSQNMEAIFVVCNPIYSVLFLHCEFKNILPICILKNTCPVLCLINILLVSKATLITQLSIQSSLPLQIHNDVKLGTADAP